MHRFKLCRSCLHKSTEGKNHGTKIYLGFTHPDSHTDLCHSDLCHPQIRNLRKYFILLHTRTPTPKNWLQTSTSKLHRNSYKAASEGGIPKEVCRRKCTEIKKLLQAEQTKGRLRHSASATPEEHINNCNIFTGKCQNPTFCLIRNITKYIAFHAPEINHHLQNLICTSKVLQSYELICCPKVFFSSLSQDSTQTPSTGIAASFRAARQLEAVNQLCSQAYSDIPKITELREKFKGIKDMLNLIAYSISTNLPRSGGSEVRES
ncbi:hypothetical protein M758_UG333200 [Ceratodon purpureus]|nr:hypothetical protein M758_UG333200 [Ceratodon purpureus]